MQLSQHILPLGLSQGHETHSRRDKACRERLQIKRANRRIIEGQAARGISQHDRIGPRHPVTDAHRGQSLGQRTALRGGLGHAFARPGQGQRQIAQHRKIRPTLARGQHQDRIIASRTHGQHSADPLRQPSGIAHPPLDDLGL